MASTSLFEKPPVYAIIKAMINICLYEDAGYQNLFPLTVTKPIYNLRMGTSTLFEKFNHFFSYANITLHCRDYLKRILKETYHDYPINTINTGTPCLFINGRVIMTEELFAELQETAPEKNTLYTYQGQVVATYVRGDLLESLRSMLNSTPTSKELIEKLRTKTVTKELDSAYLISNLWDILAYNQDILVQDFYRNTTPGIVKGNLSTYSVIYNENNVFIDHNTTIEDFVLIDATHGPVYIENNVHIESHSRLEGPLYIGENTRILGGKIKGSTIGRNCKIAGEVSASVIQSYTNKAHGGFIGHSVIGEWVNLGAYTTTSNLKSNYSGISLLLEDQRIESGQTFIGSIIGDHVKTGIHTTLNTGTIIGLGSVVYDSGYHDKFIPLFSWGTPGNYTAHQLDKFFTTAEQMMKRRNKKLTDGEKELYEFVYQRHKKALTTRPV